MADVLPEQSGQIEQIIFDKATDGKLFNNAADCTKYQHTIDLIKNNIYFFNSSFTKFPFATNDLNNFNINMKDYDYIAVSLLDSWNKLLETYSMNINTTERELPIVTKDGYYYYDETLDKWKSLQDERNSLNVAFDQIQSSMQGTS